MDGFQIAPLSRVLAVSGRFGPEEDDRFSGVAVAIGWWPVGPDSAPPDPLYLVSDPRRSRPMWVASTEISGTAFGTPGNG